MATSIKDNWQEPLSGESMREVMERLMTGKMSAEEMRGFLQGLASRGETAEEIAAAAATLRRHAVKLPLSQTQGLCDTCGTGGDRSGTFNISTLAALVAASCGVRVAKHGNRAASSQCGSADVLEGLGLNLEAPPERVARSIDELGFGFCFARVFHPAMKVVAQVRRELGIRTIFNIIGPLANPAPLMWQLVGVPDPKLIRPVAEAMTALGIRHGVVVRGADGLDEMTTTDETDVLEIRAGQSRAYTVRPEDLGCSRVSLAQLQGGDVSRNVQIAREVLQGTPSHHRDIVAMNAAGALYAANHAKTLLEGKNKAEAALEAGKPWALLERVVKLSRASEKASRGRA